mmetsp:Transcript_3263/g.10721  ORF Transcript_3263/g.10721 Transcript_3263/m.10721 type:complete len:213 (+) Transcript_3263:675-1313(+)
MTTPPSPGGGGRFIESRSSLSTSRPGASRDVYRSKYRTCLMRSANSRGKRIPYPSATRATAATARFSCVSSMALAAAPALAVVAMSAVMLSIEAMTSPMSFAKAADCSSESSLVKPIFSSARPTPAMSPAGKERTKSSIPSAVAAGMAPTIPKSMKATRPSVRTSRLPACTSAWNHSLVSTLLTHVFSATMSASSGCGWYLRTDSRSMSGTP